MTPEEYDAWYGTPRGRWIGETEYRLMHRLISFRSGETVLDVGCGTGWFTRRAAAAGVSAVGLDRDADALNFACGHEGPPTVFVRGDAARLPFADDAFDAVMSVTALCFVERWQAALAEMVRVARRGFVLGLLNRNSLLWLSKSRGEGQGTYQGAHWHVYGEVDEALRNLPVNHLRHGYAVYLPSGSALARISEAVLPSSLPLGSFLAVAGEVAS